MVIAIATPMMPQLTNCLMATKAGSGSVTRRVNVAAAQAKFTPAHR